MKKKFTPLKPLILFTFITLVFCSCTKEVAGPKGDTGAPGKDGNANVSSTNAFIVNSPDWTAGGLFWITYLYYDKITVDIIDKGTVQVYMQKDGFWWALPYLEGDSYINYGIEIGRVKLVHGESHGGLPDRPLLANYRVVVIAGSQLVAHPNTDWSNYEETIKVLSTTP